MRNFVGPDTWNFLIMMFWVINIAEKKLHALRNM